MNRHDSQPYRIASDCFGVGTASQHYNHRAVAVAEHHGNVDHSHTSHCSTDDVDPH